MKKRLLSILLTLCMVLCLVPATAFAATQPVGSWSGLQDLMNRTNDLSVTLSSDISWGGSSLTVPAGKTVTLDLNGKAIDAQGKGTAIVVNGTLTIKNSGDDLAGPIGNGAGPITGNIKNGKAGDKEAGGILVAGGGKLVMNSGWLTNCVDDSDKPIAAGGIYVSGNAEFEMNGGIITGCSGRDLLCAAGVVNYGTFTMSGNATISGSKTTTGGDGVAICNVGTLNANGGTVQTGQSCTNNATIQNTGGSATVFYSNVLNTGFGTIKGGTYSYPVENAGTIAGGTFNGAVSNTGIVTGGTFNGATTGIYTVTFDSGVPSQIRANCPATAPDATTRKGYTFDGWIKDGTSYGFTENVTENISLTANWTAKSYTVRFDTNGGTTIADKTLTWNDMVLTGVSDPVKAGFGFTGWTFGGRNVFSGTTYASLASDDTVMSITLTAQWTALTCAVRFDTNGGSTVQAQNVAYGGKAQEPAVPTKPGYTFAGWHLNGEAYDFTSPVTEDMTLTAQWTANQYTITFDTAGGSAIDPITQDYGTTINAPAAPSKTGYTFIGWEPELPPTMPAENVTVTAQWRINQYTISFDSAGGSAIAPITQDYGSTIAAPANPTKTGYIFTGWSPALPATMPAENLTVTAKWTINQYTITFDTAGGSEIAPITQDYGTDITAPANPTKTGYTFTGWSPALPATMPAENLTVTAQWTIDQYTITFDTAGGSAIDPITQDYGTTINAPAAPSKTGYTFIGWEPELPPTMPAENVTVTAQWRINQYTISFDSAGGSAIAPITQDYGSTIAAPANPTKTGYTFTGWSPALPATMPAENLTVTAQWTVNRYTITYDTDGGSEVAPITQDYGTDITAPTAPTKTGYTFTGWSPALPATMPAESLTVMAQWTVNRYTISFNTDGGSEVAPITQDYGTAITAPTAPTKTGYTFTGWEPELPPTMPAENLTVTAQWTANRYTISFNTDGGSEVAPITQDYGTAITAPAAPTKTGYTFTGWEPELPATMPAENLTVTAQWTVNQYTITYDLAGGTAEGNLDTYTIETGAFTLKNPTKSGYTFTGWSGTGLDGENNMTVTIPTGSTGNRTYTAHWRYNGSGHSYNYYTIKATAGAGGSISPSGNVSVREGRDQTFTITPDKGYAVANVKIDGRSIGAVKSYTFENVRRNHTIEVSFARANEFIDVPAGSYFYEAVMWAVENGITTGASASRFDPNGICTRAQAVTFLWRAAGSPEPETRTMPFTDVPVGSYYYDAVLWAVENGITEGTSDTRFSPNATCTRAQIVAFLWRSEKSPAAGTANPFADVKSTAYYAGAVLWAVREDITKGTTNTTFSPDADCTRAQIVTFLWRCKK